MDVEPRPCAGRKEILGKQGIEGEIVMLKSNGKQGVPQGGVASPLFSNIYLTEVDKMLERAKEVTRYGKYTYVEYARFADDLVILIDAHPRHPTCAGGAQ
jgi:RNA-directed DNA polymerase